MSLLVNIYLSLDCISCWPTNIMPCIGMFVLECWEQRPAVQTSPWSLLQLPVTVSSFRRTSVGDSWHFGVDPDSDPRIRTSDQWIRIQLRIRIRLLSSMTVRSKKTFHIFSYQLTNSHIFLSLKNLIFCWNLVLKFYFASIISVLSIH